jgi:hypothetical protein
MKIAAIVLAATLAIANARCLLACTPAPGATQAGSPCHHRQQPAPAPAQQSCAHALVIDLAPAPAKADLVETGVIAGAAARNAELKAPEFARGTLYRETSPPLALHRGLFAVLRI